MTHIHLVKIFI